MNPCGQCGMCADGACNLCADLDEVGFTRPGAFAEALCLPAASLRPLPPGLPGSEACLLEPLCIALHAVERAPDLAGRAVGVIGAGTVGLLVAQLAAANGAKSVVVADPLPSRRQVAGEFGLSAHPAAGDWAPELPDVVFEATGVAAVYPDGLLATRPGGAYVLVGYSGDDTVMVQPSAVMLRELTVYGVLSGYRQLDKALDLVSSGVVRLAPLVGPARPLAEYRSVLEDHDGPAPLRYFFTGPAA
jgi:threonine dehydrogenase-like Zn-dependent dehydrogenase